MVANESEGADFLKWDLLCDVVRDLLSKEVELLAIVLPVATRANPLLEYFLACLSFYSIALDVGEVFQLG